jgi:hypothetical protein
VLNSQRQRLNRPVRELDGEMSKYAQISALKTSSIRTRQFLPSLTCAGLNAKLQGRTLQETN